MKIRTALVDESTVVARPKAMRWIDIHLNKPHMSVVQAYALIVDDVLAVCPAPTVDAEGKRFYPPPTTFSINHIRSGRRVMGGFGSMEVGTTGARELIRRLGPQVGRLATLGDFNVPGSQWSRKDQELCVHIRALVINLSIELGMEPPRPLVMKLKNGNGGKT